MVDLLQAVNDLQLFCHQSLEFGVLRLQVVELSGIGYFHAAELIAPARESLLGSVVPLAQAPFGISLV